MDWLDQQVIRHRTYEPEITQLLVKLLPPGGCLWDVGANAGVHALSVRARRPDASVFAFEPSPSEFVRLSRNALINDLRVSAYCIALSDARGYHALSVVETGNSGHNSLRPWPDVAYSRTIPVWCDTADLLSAEGLTEPHVLKMDVEGNELEVLHGMTTLLGRSELCNVVFEAQGAASPAVRELSRWGFALEQITPGNWLASR